MNEDERIARIAALLGGGAPKQGVRVGIGDDCAVLDAPGGVLVWTVDEQVEGVHFRASGERVLCSYEDVGYRATMAAASDLAAKGARPLGALASLVLPPSVDDAELEAIVHGQRQACDELGSAIIGGNLSRGTELALSTTWLGTCEAPILRSGARPGDNLLVCGDLGLAAAGFRALDAGLEAAPDAVRAWRRPRARVEEGLRMTTPPVRAAIDVSDGLARDAGHLARASGVQVVIDEARLRAALHPATSAVAKAVGVDALDLALGGGEDYALLVAMRERRDARVHVHRLDRGGPRGDPRGRRGRAASRFRRVRPLRSRARSETLTERRELGALEQRLELLDLRSGAAPHRRDEPIADPRGLSVLRRLGARLLRLLPKRTAARCSLVASDACAGAVTAADAGGFDHRPTEGGCRRRRCARVKGKRWSALCGGGDRSRRRAQVVDGCERRHRRRRSRRGDGGRHPCVLDCVVLRAPDQQRQQEHQARHADVTNTGISLAAAHAVAAVEALVASPIADGDVAADVADRGVAHHRVELLVEPMGGGVVRAEALVHHRGAASLAGVYESVGWSRLTACDGIDGGSSGTALSVLCDGACSCSGFT